MVGYFAFWAPPAEARYAVACMALNNRVTGRIDGLRRMLLTALKTAISHESSPRLCLRFVVAQGVLLGLLTRQRIRRSSPSPPLLRQKSTVDGQHRAGDERSFVGGQKGDGVGDLRRFT